jgi:hypothetical protein
MALPSERIFLRSPYYVSKERSNLDLIIIDLFIYTGTLTTDKPSEATFRLQSSASVNGTGNKFAEIDIAELARDYVDVTYDFTATDPTNAVWIEYDLYYADAGALALVLDSSVSLTGVNGYGWFEDGYNPDPEDRAFISNDYVIVPTGSSAIIPVLQDYVTEWKLYDTGTISPSGLIETVTAPTPTENTANVIDYINTFSTFGTPSFIRLSYSGGRADQDIRIVYYDECEETAVDCAFVNRFGAVQHAYMFGRKSMSSTSDSTTYKRNILSGQGSYDTKKHQTAVMNKNGKRIVNISTGWYPEDYNGVWQEMIDSETVWLNLNSKFLNFNAFKDIQVTAPVILMTQQLKFKQRKYDKLINYDFVFEFAADRINSVR